MRPETGVSSLLLDDVIYSVIALADVDRSSMKQHVYSLHGYFMSAEEVAKTVCGHCPGFEYEYAVIEDVDGLISQWPSVIDDSDARRDWGWNPKYSFAQSADRMCALLVSGDTQ